MTGGAVRAARRGGGKRDRRQRTAGVARQQAGARAHVHATRAHSGTAGRYQIIAGAFRDSSSADSLMMLLRLRHQLDRGQGKVVRVPCVGGAEGNRARLKRRRSFVGIA